MSRILNETYSNEDSRWNNYVPFEEKVKRNYPCLDGYKELNTKENIKTVYHRQKLIACELLTWKGNKWIEIKQPSGKIEVAQAILFVKKQDLK